MSPRVRRATRAPEAGPTGTAYDAAVRFLGTRPRSVSEIHRHLRGKKFDDDAIAAAIDKLRAQRYVDDDAFARYWLEQRERFRPRGDRGIRMELAQKGVSRDVIDVVLGERAPDADVEQAKKAITRPMTRWATVPPPERKRKIHAYLAARGFDYATIEEVIRASVEDVDDEG
ncbi:MAG TPA: RecX family transcriptional regulator [Candidatus Limnocylindrales bacterium]|nr:RecX family transcriptional regulator [Candidatus Limnocylindrales bacterium]